MAEANTPAPRPVEEVFVISRVFAAPRDLVFGAWTACEHLVHWWRPNGYTVISCKNDLRPDGVMHYGARAPDGGAMWGKWVYREVVKPERLVFIVSFSDEAGGTVRHPLAPDWPLQTLSRITFVAHDAKTGLTVQWSPFTPAETERNAFEAGRDSMRQGWSGTFDRLADYLATL